MLLMFFMVCVFVVIRLFQIIVLFFVIVLFRFDSGVSGRQLSIALQTYCVDMCNLVCLYQIYQSFSVLRICGIACLFNPLAQPA